MRGWHNLSFFTLHPESAHSWDSLYFRLRYVMIYTLSHTQAQTDLRHRHTSVAVTSLHFCHSTKHMQACKQWHHFTTGRVLKYTNWEKTAGYNHKHSAIFHHYSKDTTEWSNETKTDRERNVMQDWNRCLHCSEKTLYEAMQLLSGHIWLNLCF